jgi:hypothetical protein
MAQGDLNWLERKALRHFMKSFIKKYWPTVMAAAGSFVTFEMPALQAYVTHNPKTAVGVLLGCIIAAYHARAPKDKK